MGMAKNRAKETKEQQQQIASSRLSASMEAFNNVASGRGFSRTTQ
jgi:hypothetical protein